MWTSKYKNSLFLVLILLLMVACSDDKMNSKDLGNPDASGPSDQSGSDKSPSNLPSAPVDAASVETKDPLETGAPVVIKGMQIVPKSVPNQLDVLKRKILGQLRNEFPIKHTMAPNLEGRAKGFGTELITSVEDCGWYVYGAQCLGREILSYKSWMYFIEGQTDQKWIVSKVRDKGADRPTIFLIKVQNWSEGQWMPEIVKVYFPKGEILPGPISPELLLEKDSIKYQWIVDFEMNSDKMSHVWEVARNPQNLRQMYHAFRVAREDAKSNNEWYMSRQLLRIYLMSGYEFLTHSHFANYIYPMLDLTETLELENEDSQKIHEYLLARSEYGSVKQYAATMLFYDNTSRVELTDLVISAMDHMIERIRKKAVQAVTFSQSLDLNGEIKVIQKIEDSSDEVKEAAYWSARQRIDMGPEHLKALREITEKQVPAKSRLMSFRLISFFKTNEATDVLVRGLTESADSVRDEIIKILDARQLNRSHFDQLSELMTHPNWRVRMSAAQVLGETGSPMALQILQQHREDSQPEVKVMVLEGLYKINGPS